MFDEGIAVEEVLCESANDPAMSSGGFGGLGGAIGVREEDGVLGSELYRTGAGRDESLCK